MVKILCFLILLFLQPSCFSMSNSSFKISELDDISNQITVDFAKKMQKKGLHACGLGGREDQGKIIDFKVSFQYNKTLDISSARRLIVETVLLFLEEINSNARVQQYLSHYPFTPDDVIISILPDCSVLNEKECSSSIIVKIFLGKISYCVDDEIVMPLHHLHEESFEEARKIVNS